MKLNTLVCLCALLALPGLAENTRAQSSTETSSARRLTVPIDESQLVALKGNVHPLALSLLDRGLAPVSAPTGRIALLLRRSTAQQQALTEYLSDVENPSSSAFHKWLTPAQYGAKFGVDTGDVQAIELWLQSHGFRIEKVPAAGSVIVFSGTIDQVQSTFHTSIHAFAVEGETRFANVTDVSVPAALAPLIAGVGPLNNFRVRPGAQVSATGTWDAASHAIEPDLTLFSGTTPLLFVDPADAATIYDTPNSTLNLNYAAGTSYTGTGVTVGIVGVSNINMQDISNYRTAFLGESAGAANLPTVILEGNDPGVVSGGAGVEALLDNEVAGGLAPGAKVDFYISAGSDLSDGLFNAIERAIDDNAVDILSISFGNCESVLGTSGNQLMLELSEQAAAQGISLTVSAGDNGSAGCDDFDTAFTAQDGLAVSGFASTPYVIAVGGTDFDVLSSSFSTYVSNSTNGSAPYYRTAKSYIPEKPWNNTTTINASVSQNVAYKNSLGKTNIVAGSGGVSSIYGKPAFQSALTPADNARDLPDVSLFAGDGFYSAYWAVCADTEVIQGAQGPASDCANTNGQFGNGSTFEGVGGTSASAPALAGMLALAVQATGGRLGQADTVLYQLAKAHPSYFHDITSGDNAVPCNASSPGCGTNLFMTGYNAGAGYDLASGLGSLDAAAVINNWKSVSLGSTATTLQINGSGSAYTGVHGAALALNAGVTATSGTPTGAVAITDNADGTAGGTGVGPQNNGQIAISLTAGAGSATYNGLPGGSYTVTAHYGGDSSFAASTSTPISVLISPEASTTSLKVNAYNGVTANSISNVNIPYGSYVIADAEITGTAEGLNTQGIATGTVQFLNSGATLGSAVVSSGNEASWPPLNNNPLRLPGGTYSLTAQYSGDSSYAPSTGMASFTVVKAPTTVTSGGIQTSAQYGNPGQIGAEVEAMTTGVAPTGTFQFYVDGQANGGPQPIYESSGYDPGAANPEAEAYSSASYNFLTLGQHTYSASYTGDTNYAGGSSPTETFTVVQALPTFGDWGFESPLDNPAAVGQSATGVALLRGSQFGIAPSGTVTFYDNNVALTDPVTYVTSGNTLNATTQHVFTTAGTHPITEIYSGDTNYTSATSPIQSLLVYGPISLSAGQLNALTPGQAGSAMVSVAPHGGFTGAVSLTCAVTTSIKGGIDPPTCSVPTSVTIAGTAAAAATLSVQTTAGNVGALQSPLRRFLGGGGEVAVALVLLFGIPARRRKWSVLLGLLAFAFIAGAIGCGGGGGGTGGGGGQSFGTTAGSYTITVTGTDAATGKITANTAVTLTVN